MGSTVHITLNDQQKPDYVVATGVAKAAFTATTTQLALWFGGDYAGSKLSTINGLKRALEVIRQNGNATPLTTNITRAIVTAPGGRQNIVYAGNVAKAEPTDVTNVIMYGSAFQPMAGSKVQAHGIRAIEKYMEAVQKGA